MSTLGSIDAPVQILGGLVADMAPSELPDGVSPDCPDCQFTKSAAETRPGLTSVFAAIAGNPTINYIKTYQNIQEVIETLVWDSGGNLWAEESNGSLTLIALALYAQSPWAFSTTLFGREYLAFSDGKMGQDAPRQWDGTNLDRVTQGGPGAAPTVVDYAPTFNIHAASTGLTQQAGGTVSSIAEYVPGFYQVVVTVAGIYNQGDVVTITGASVAAFNTNWTISAGPGTGSGQTTTIFYFNAATGLGTSLTGTVYSATATCTLTAAPSVNLTVGTLVTVAGAGVAGYDVTNAKILSVVSTTVFTYTATAGNLGASGGGTVAVAGNISAGVHGLTVAFVTRQGYITIPAPPTSWTAGGNAYALVSNIAVGPANVIARILLFTVAGQSPTGSAYFYIPPEATTLGDGSTVINDNVTTTAVVNFTDAILQGATSGAYLFSEIPLPEVAGVARYNQRLFWWGERNTLKNWQNLDMCGGFGQQQPSGAYYPLGWTPDTTSGAGGGYTGVVPYWGGTFKITGDGATATRGLITQSATDDIYGVPRIQAGTLYTVKVRVLRNNTLAAGSLHVHLYSASGAINTTGLTLAAGGVTTQWAEYTASLVDGVALTTIPSDLVLRVYADGTPTFGGYFAIGQIEILPTGALNNLSTVRASNADSPEQIDGVTGLLNVSENDGQAIRAAFQMRGNLYFVKERSLFYTEDNQQEPDTWTITQVSATIGTPSIRGVGLGEDWAVIASRSGLYIFSGGEPLKISQEVAHSASGLTLAWDQINWQYGHTIWVTVDTINRRIYVGAPFGSATSPNYILCMDYRDVDGGADAIAGAPPIIISYRGVKIVRDKSRKSSFWTISANHGAMVERFDGTQQLFLGCGSYGNQNATGKVYQLDPTNQTDDGSAIPSYYLTAFTPQRETEQELQIASHRKLFYYMTAFIEGSGYINVTAHPDSESNPQIVAQWRLSSPANKDMEAPLNVLGERVAFKFAPDSTVAGNWFRLQKLTPSMNADPNSPVRGQN